MVLDKKILQEDFKRFNKEYFSGELKTPQFSFRRLKNVLGLCYNNLIVLTSYYDFPKETYQEILLHEMVHLYLRQKRLKDNKMHGRLFMSVANRINKQGGWDINGNTSVRGVPITDKSKKWNVCCYKTINGRYFMFSIAKNSLTRFKNLMLTHDTHFIKPHLFECNDSRLCGCLTECRTRVRGYYITEEEYNRLKSAYKNKITPS